MTNKEKAYLTWWAIQQRKAKREEIKEREHTDYICKYFEKRKKTWGVKFGGYRK